MYFDFEINKDFKITQVPLNYFNDNETKELVYYQTLAEQVVLYNFN